MFVTKKRYDELNARYYDVKLDWEMLLDAIEELELTNRTLNKRIKELTPAKKSVAKKTTVKKPVKKASK